MVFYNFFRRHAFLLIGLGFFASLHSSGTPEAAPADGQKQLYEYCLSGDIGALNKLLAGNSSYNLNAQNTGGTTALMFAAAQGHDDIVQLLLNLGANQNLQDNQGKTALMMAIRRKRRNVIPLLCTKKTNKTLCDKDGKTIINYADDTSDAAIVRQLQTFCAAFPVGSPSASVASEATRRLSAHNHGSVVHGGSGAGTGALSGAGAGVGTGVSHAVALAMVDQNKLDGFGCTPLMYAAGEGNIAQIRHLLAQNPNLDMRHAGDGRTALILAVQNGHVDAVRELMLVSNLNIQDKSGKTAEDYASIPAIKEIFTAYRASLLSSFITAATTGDSATVMRLIGMVDVNYVDPATGKTALMCACENNHKQVAEILIVFTASKDIVCAADGNTALHYAVAGGHTDIVKLLVKPFGMTSHATNLDIENSAGDTASAIATRLGNAEIIQVLADAQNMTCTCIICFAPITVESRDIISCQNGMLRCTGQSWLETAMQDRSQHLYHKACLQGSVRFRAICPAHNTPLTPACLAALNEGAAPAVPAAAVAHVPYAGYYPGCTELTAAVKDRNVPRMQELIAAGADVNEPDAQGMSPLAIYLYDAEDISILTTLLDASANVLAAAFDGLTAHQVANRYFGEYVPVRYLVNARYARQIAGLPGFRN